MFPSNTALPLPLRLTLRGGAAIAIVIALLAAVLSSALVLRAVREQPASNSYALVAQSLIEGRPDVPRCFDRDCAHRGGKTYVVFPPFPGVVAAPLVLLFGPEARGFVALAILCLALSLLAWRDLARRAGLPGPLVLALIAALAFASPLYYVTLHSDGIWFFAQALAFLLVSAAIREAVRGRLLTAGAALGAAMLCRQMSVFYAPVLLVLALQPGERLLVPGRLGKRARQCVLLGAPLAAAVAAYFAYNAWRFGDPLDTGYADIGFPAGIMAERVAAHGVWSLAYLPFNLFYLLFQGFHAEFAGTQRVALSGLDDAGTSVLAASPWLLYAALAPLRRDLVVCLALVVGMAAALLLYHSNGYSQYNAQRYALDWLPAALLVLLAALRRLRGELFPLLVAWAMALNVATVATLALTKGAEPHRDAVAWQLRPGLAEGSCADSPGQGCLIPPKPSSAGNGP